MRHAVKIQAIKQKEIFYIMKTSNAVADKIGFVLDYK